MVTQQELRSPRTTDRTQMVQQAEVSRQQTVAVAQEEARVKAIELKQQQEIAAQQKAQSEYNNALDSVQRAARDGPAALGLLATYGEGLERQMARDILKQSNISPSEAIADIQLKAIGSSVGSTKVVDAFSGTQIETGGVSRTEALRELKAAGAITIGRSGTIVDANTGRSIGLQYSTSKEGVLGGMYSAYKERQSVEQPIVTGAETTTIGDESFVQRLKKLTSKDSTPEKSSDLFITFPSQTKGSSFYTPEKGFYVDPTKIEQTSEAPSFFSTIAGGLSNIGTSASTKFIDTFGELRIGGKPLWAIVSNTPTYETTIKDGAIVPKYYTPEKTVNLPTGSLFYTPERGFYEPTTTIPAVPKPSGQAIQAAYNIYAGGSGLAGQAIIKTTEVMGKGLSYYGSLLPDTITINAATPQKVTYNPQLPVSQQFWLPQKTEVKNVLKEPITKGLYVVGAAAPLLFGEVVTGGAISPYYAAAGAGLVVSPKTNVQEKFFGALLAAPFAYRTYKSATSFERYAQPEVQRISWRPSKIPVNVMKEKGIVPTLKIAGTKGRANVNIFGKVKGKTTTTESYPSDIFTGKIDERVAGFFGREIKGKGIAEYNSLTGEQTQMTFFDKGVTKLIKTDKSGLSTVSIFKKGKLKYTAETEAINPQLQIRGIGNVKVKTDYELNKPYNILKQDVTIGKVRAKQTTVSIQKNIDDVGGIQQFADDLKSKKVFQEFQIQTVRRGDIRGGLYTTTRTQRGFSDVIESGPRKGTVEISVNGVKVRVQKQVGQRIEYGVPKEKDISKFIDIGGKRTLIRKISPTTTRQTQIANPEVTFEQLYINPKSKMYQPVLVKQRAADLEIQAQAKGLRDAIKQVRTKAEKEYFEQRVAENIAFIKTKFGEGKDTLKSLFSFKREAVSTGAEGLPSMVGGQGLQIKPISLNAADIKALRALDSMSNVVYVSPVKLGRVAAAPKINIPIIRYESAFKPALSYGTGAILTTAAISTMKADTRSLVTNLSVSSIKSDVSVKPIENIRLDTNVLLRTDVVPIQTTRTEQTQQTRQIVDSILDLKQRQPPQEPIKPTRVIPPLPLSLDSLSQYARKKKKRKTIFEAFSKRFGKELSLGKFESQESAEKKLGSFLRGTLAASGKIKREGTALSFTSLKSFKGLEFRPSKGSMTTIVQRRGFRLGTGTERREIKKFKRSKFNVW